MLGSVQDFETKLDNLMLVYKKVFSKAGWAMYDTVSLKFKNQVVCTRKKNEIKVTIYMDTERYIVAVEIGRLEDYRRDRNSFSERSRYCAGSRYRTIDRECEAGFRR